MPVYNEAATVERGDPRGARAPPARVRRADRRRRRLHRRHARAPRPRGAGPTTSASCSHDRNRGKGAAVRTGSDATPRELLARSSTPTWSTTPSDLSSSARAAARRATQTRCSACRAFDGYTSHSFLYVLGNRVVTLGRERALQRLHRRHHDLPQGDRDRAVQVAAAARRRLRRSSPRSPRASCSGASASSRCQCATAPGRTAEGKKLTSRDGLLVVVSLIHYRLTPPSRPPRASRGPITVQTIARRRLQRRHRRRERSLS